MTEKSRQARNAVRLQEIYHTVRPKFAAVLKDLEGHGLRPRIQEAWRSPADQLKAFKSGHSKLKYGYHNVTWPDGSPAALAADILDDDHPLNPPTKFLLMLCASANAHGLGTGITWGLPKTLKFAIGAAIVSKTWDANVKTGWDPTHVETLGISVAEAKAGKRPK